MSHKQNCLEFFQRERVEITHIGLQVPETPWKQRAFGYFMLYCVSDGIHYYWKREGIFQRKEPKRGCRLMCNNEFTCIVAV